jgi:hypothetical protein
LHNRTPTSRTRLDANAIIDGWSNPLFAAKVAFGRLNRNVPQKKWICSNSPPDAWQSRAKVRRSGGANVKGLAKNTAVTKLTRNRPILALLTSLGC